MIIVSKNHYLQWNVQINSFQGARVEMGRNYVHGYDDSIQVDSFNISAMDSSALFLISFPIHVSHAA
jgi:hypothetical protein